MNLFACACGGMIELAAPFAIMAIAGLFTQLWNRLLRRRV